MFKNKGFKIASTVAVVGILLVSLSLTGCCQHDNALSSVATQKKNELIGVRQGSVNGQASRVEITANSATSLVARGNFMGAKILSPIVFDNNHWYSYNEMGERLPLLIDRSNGGLIIFPGQSLQRVQVQNNQCCSGKNLKSALFK